MAFDLLPPASGITQHEPGSSLPNATESTVHAESLTNLGRSVIASIHSSNGGKYHSVDAAPMDDNVDDLHQLFKKRSEERDRLRTAQKAERAALEVKFQMQQAAVEAKIVGEFRSLRMALQDERARMAQEVRVGFEEEKTRWGEERERQRAEFEKEMAAWEAECGHRVDVKVARAEWDAERAGEWAKLEEAKAKWEDRIARQNISIRKGMKKLAKLQEHKEKTKNAITGFKDTIGSLQNLWEQSEHEKMVMQSTILLLVEEGRRDLETRLRQEIAAEMQQEFHMNVNDLMDQISMRNEILENENEKEWEAMLGDTNKTAATTIPNAQESRGGSTSFVIENADVADRIRLRNLVDRAQMFLAGQAGLTPFGDETHSMTWRRHLGNIPDGPQRIEYARQLLERRMDNTRVRTFLRNTKALEVLCDFPSRLRQAGNELHGSFPRTHYLQSIKSSWKYDRRIEPGSLEALVELISPR